MGSVANFLPSARRWPALKGTFENVGVWIWTEVNRINFTAIANI